MARSRASAKTAGAAFERLVADFLAERVDDRIDRRVKTGAKDCGDIGGVRLANGARVVIEAKNTAKINLAGWIAEAHEEAVNDGAAVGVVAHKRHGKGQAADQWITMTLADLAVILNAQKA